MTNFTQTHYDYQNVGPIPQEWTFQLIFTHSNDHCSASCELMGDLCHYWYVRLKECGHGNFYNKGPAIGYSDNVPLFIKDSKKTILEHMCPEAAIRCPIHMIFICFY